MTPLELSPSVERTLVSIIGLVGGFTLVGIAMVVNSTHFTEIIGFCGPLAGAIVMAWVGGANTSQLGRQTSEAMRQSGANAVEVVKATQSVTNGNGNGVH